MLACYKTKRKREAVKVYPYGREVCEDNAAGLREYKRRIQEMSERQCDICPICSRRMSELDRTFEHEDLRGMGGARRDDRIWKEDEDGNKIPVNFAVHWTCNGVKGSRRIQLSREGEIVCHMTTLEQPSKKSLAEASFTPPLRYKDFFKSQRKG